MEHLPTVSSHNQQQFGHLRAHPRLAPVGVAAPAQSLQACLRHTSHTPANHYLVRLIASLHPFHRLSRTICIPATQPSRPSLHKTHNSPSRQTRAIFLLSANRPLKAFVPAKPSSEPYTTNLLRCQQPIDHRQQCPGQHFRPLPPLHSRLHMLIR